MRSRKGWPRAARCAALSRVPAPVIALVVMTLLCWSFTLPVETIGSRFGGIPRTLPDLALPPFSLGDAPSSC